MTLPLNTILPLHSENIQQGGKNLEKYMRELVFTMQRQYEDIAQAVNGDIRNSQEPGNQNYTPTIEGATVAGVGTYTNQIGWVLRQGLMVDVWFNIKWTAHTGTGGLVLTLPYKSAVTPGNPWVGSIIASGITFTGYLCGSVSPDTRNLRIIDTQSGGSAVEIAILNSATLTGHVRYVGQAIERD